MEEINKTEKIQYYTIDPVIENQKFVLLSFLPKEKYNNGKGKFDLFKFRGAFGTEEEARAYTQKLRKIDNDFDIFIAPVGSWQPFNPNIEDIKDQEYYEEQLNDIMKNYREQELRKEQIEKERRDDMIRKALTSNKNKEKDNKTNEENEKDMETKYNENIKSAEDCLSKLEEAFNKIGK